MEQKYYSIEWIDKEKNYHQDYFFPVDVDLIQTSFYHRCEEPKAEALKFFSQLTANNIKTIKYEEAVYTQK